MAAVPVLDAIDIFDLNDPMKRVQIVDRIDRAGREMGAFVVSGHGVPSSAIEAMYAATVDLFALPAQVKAQLAADPPSRFQGWCSHALAGGSNTAETFAVSRFDKPADVRAAGYTTDDAPPANLWPQDYPRLREAWLPYLAHMQQLAVRILEAAAELIDAPPGWLAQTFDHHASGMIANWYAPRSTGTAGLHQQPHTDFGALTILFQDNGPNGLEVMDRTGTWHPVPPEPDTFVVLFGELLQRWSDARFRATPHRVSAPPDNATPRLSVPYFCHPHRNAPTTAVNGSAALTIAPRAADLLRTREARH